MPPWAAPAVAAVAVLSVAGALLPSARASGALIARGQEPLETLSWVRQHTPCEARILANRRTIGTFETVTGRVGSLEGMAPYLRPAELRQVVGLLEAAERFFQDPASGQAFLQREGVDFVVILRQGVPFGPLGPALDGTVGSLEQAPFLRVVARTPEAEVFQVTSAAGGASSGVFPSPVGHPGYRCQTTALPGSSSAGAAG